MRTKQPHGGLTPAAFEARVLGFIALGIVALGLVFCLPPVAQNPSYQAFADDRMMLGVPSFMNVASNLPFIVIGVLGLRLILRQEGVERWPFLVLFTGILLTGFGSSYYHLHPDNDRLVWDRLPMTIAFMGLFASTIGERIGRTAGRWLLWPLVSGWASPACSAGTWGSNAVPAICGCTASCSSIPW